jgi:hypothetical protein
MPCRTHHAAVRIGLLLGETAVDHAASVRPSRNPASLEVTRLIPLRRIATEDVDAVEVVVRRILDEGPDRHLVAAFNSAI